MKLYALVMCVAALLVAVSCSTGPAPPQPGTPGFYWGAARETFRGGDLLKTNDDLLEIIQTDNPFTARARAWQIVLSAGLLEGSADLAKAYAAGAKMNRNNSLPFHRQVTILRAQASHSALDFAQSVRTLLQKDTGPDILLGFEYPPGSPNQPPNLNKVSAGLVLPESEASALEAAMLERGAIRALSAAVGSPDNPARSLEMFQAGEVRVPCATFLFAAARMLYDHAAIFGDQQLDQPQRLLAMYDTASAALKATPETGETKALTAAIQAAVKKIRKT